MAKYPVEIGDDEGTADALNYLLSGPAGLGQNFAGFSSYNPPKYLTGNFRIPFSQDTAANLYIPGISLNNAVQLDDRTIQYFFTTPQATPPFALGNGLSITGITPADYNSADLRAAGNSILQIGVVACTTTYVIVRTVSPIVTPLPAYVSGGTASFDTMDLYTSTDCDVRVTVTGGTDRVFINGQLDQLISYEVVSGTQDLNVYVAIRRYRAFNNDNPTNPDYIFQPDKTIVEKLYPYTGLSGSGTLPVLDTVFTGLVDQPAPAYYRYILEVYFETLTMTPQIYVTQDELQLRGISAQVVKQ